MGTSARIICILQIARGIHSRTPRIDLVQQKGIFG